METNYQVLGGWGLDLCQPIEIGPATLFLHRSLAGVAAGCEGGKDRALGHARIPSHVPFMARRSRDVNCCSAEADEAL